MVGVGGQVFQNYPVIKDNFLSAGGDFQHLMSYGGKTYWQDDSIFLPFQPLLSDQNLVPGLSKAFLVVPHMHGNRWQCKNITVGFHTRFGASDSAVISFLEKRIDGSYDKMRTDVTYGDTGIAAYIANMNHNLSEGSTIYLEVVSTAGATLTGFSAVAQLTARTGGDSPLTAPFAAFGSYPDSAAAYEAGAENGLFYTFSNDSIIGSEGAMQYQGDTVNKYIKGFYASTSAAAAGLSYGDLYCFKDSLQGNDGKVMINGFPSITATSVCRGYYVDNDAALAGGLVAGQFYALSGSTILDVPGSVYQVL